METVLEKEASVKDADYGPHESWCDTQNKISNLCNCMVGGYIERIAALEAENAQLAAALNRIGMIGSGEKAYTSDFTNEVMGIVRQALAPQAAREGGRDG